MKRGLETDTFSGLLQRNASAPFSRKEIEVSNQGLQKTVEEANKPPPAPPVPSKLEMLTQGPQRKHEMVLQPTE